MSASRCVGVVLRQAPRLPSPRRKTAYLVPGLGSNTNPRSPFVPTDRIARHSVRLSFPLIIARTSNELRARAPNVRTAGSAHGY